MLLLGLPGKAGMVIATLPVFQHRQPSRLPVDRLVLGEVPGVDAACHVEAGCHVVTLSGVLNVTNAPALREFLLRLLRPAASRLIIDLSAVSKADAGGLAVLVGTERRARLLDGFLRLAAPVPAVAGALTETGLSLRFDIYPTLEAAISCTAPA